MFKRIFSKMISVALCVSMLFSTVLHSGMIYAAEGGTNLIIDENQLTGEYALDLSKAGNVDWMHLKGDGPDNITQIMKQTTTSSAISFNTLTNTGSEGKVDKGGDSNYLSYSWNDGMQGYETGSNDTGFGVFFPKDGRDAGPCNGNVGWNFTVAEQAEETTVVFGLGLWQAVVDVKFYINGVDTPVDTKTIQANDTSRVYKYQVTVPANTVLKVEGIQTETLSKWGNFSLSGIAVSGKGLPVDDKEFIIKQSQLAGEYALDLSKVGNVDWIHFKGDNSPTILQIKKQTTGSSAISFNVLQNTDTEGKANKGGDSNYLSYSWNDGMEGYETGSNDTGFGVFFPKDKRGPGLCSGNVGWNFTVAAQAEETTVVFGLGLWQSKVDVKFYINGEEAPSDTKKIQANGTSQVYKYQVTVPANTKLKVEATQTETLSNDGNSSFSGLAVSSEEVVDKLSLQNRYSEFQGITQSVFTEDTWKNFDAAKAAAKTILDKVDATQAEVDLAKANLEQAQSALVKKDTNVMIDYTGRVKGSYGLGGVADERDRYQTFTADESFKMGYIQVGLTKSSDNGSDLVVKLYATDSKGLPTGSVLAQTIVRKEEVINGGLTTAKLSYDLVASTRYAIAVTQTNLSNGIYCWTVMDKNYYTENEFFGKSVSGNFESEARLGTGLLRVMKELSVDRSTLEALVTEVSDYNQKVYTVESWVVLTNALESAKKCLNNFDATIEEVTTATNQLEAAKAALVFNVDIEEFDSIVAALDSVVIKGYTDSSIAAFNLAVEAAKQLDSDAPDEVKLNVYVSILNAISKLKESGQYTSETDRKLTGSFGFEGDMNAPIAFIDGSFKLVSRGGLMIRFGVTGLKEKGISIDWYNRDGYLPCYVSEYTVDNVDYKIEEFANKHMIDGNPVEVAYVKMTAINKSGEVRLLPVVSKELLPMNEAATSSLIIKDGEEVVREYAIKVDRFGNEGHTGDAYNVEPKVAFPSDQKIFEAASLVADIGRESVFENNYADMKAYWDNRLADIIDIKLPSSKDANNKDSLVNAYKAGYIYTLIIKDNTFLHVGENGYDRLFSHDTIGILQTLITAGDFEDAKSYLESVPMTGGINIENGLVDADQYWDANWKLPWAYSVYLSKTGDMNFIKEKFEDVIKKMAHSIHDDRTGVAHDGIMKKTYAIDTEGQWTVDNHAALVGLIAYKYICDELAIKESDVNKKNNYLSESQWAKIEYDSLLKKATETLENTIAINNLDYMPASVVEPNSANRCNDIRDANWASMLLFGAFAWDGYLYGADQSKAGANISMIDKTYTYGIARRADLPGASPYNFGGYPHGWYSSAYNAGYGSYALRGESYRDIGIKSYEFAVNSAMSSPFGWWEGVGSTNFPSSPEPTTTLWNHDNAAAGEGSCQHMWGQATSSKVLYDALIAERIYNDNKNISIIIGRGIPNEWINNATKDNNIVASVQNYPVLQGGRAGYQIERNGSSLKITLECNKDNSKVDAGTIEQWSVELPMMVNSISASTVGTIDNDKGIVTVLADTKEVIITLKNLSNFPNDGDNNVTALTVAGKDDAASITTKGGTLQMIATVTPSDATDKSVTWSIVSGNDYASLSAEGLLTAKANGTVTVKATSVSNPLVSNTCNIVITGNPAEPQNVAVTALTVAGKDGVANITTKGGTLQMVATVTPDDATNKAVTWSIASGSEYATLSADGLLTAKANGTVTVKVTSVSDKEVSNTCNIVITGNQAEPQNVAVTALTVAGKDGVASITTKGGTLQMVATVTPDDATNKAVTWSIVSEGSYATLSNAGLLTAIANGTVTVKATSVSNPEVSNTCNIVISGYSSGSGGGGGNTTKPVVPVAPTVPPVTNPSTPDAPKTETVKVNVSLGNGTASSAGTNIELTVKPYIQNGRTMAGVRDIANLLQVENKNIVWNAKDKSIQINKDGIFIKLVIGQKYAIVNGQKVALDVASQVKDGRTVLPIAQIARLLNIETAFGVKTKEITFSIKK